MMWWSSKDAAVAPIADDSTKASRFPRDRNTIYAGEYGTQYAVRYALKYPVTLHNGSTQH